MVPPKRRLFDQHQAVIDRFMRLSVRRKLRPILFSLVRRISRVRLRCAERRKLPILDSAIGSIARAAAKTKQHGFASSTIVLNVALFFLLADRDIQSMKVDALTHPDSWRRGLAARVILLTIHELDLDKVAGQDFHRALVDGGVPEELRAAVTKALRTVRKAQSRARGQFSDLRNSTIAHRDRNAVQQFREISGIDGLEVTKIAGEFYEGTKQFIDVLPTVMMHVGTLPGLLNQLKVRQTRVRRLADVSKS